MKPFSLYIHIPFCHHKCPYCDFNTYAVTHAPEKDYTEGLLAELDARAVLPEWKGRPIQTIFFGGGTPSIFAPESITQVLKAAAERFPIAKDAEVTMEANPGTVSYESLAGYHAGGVNRISLGAQSFQRTQLRSLGRLHTPEQVETAVAATREAGIKNLSIDLIFGAPTQTLGDFHADLNTALALKTDHISAYGLTIEKGTPFFSAYERGDLTVPTEEATISMMEALESTLVSAGFSRYEVSNFALPKFEARHNLAYWNGDDYLGLGAGAHSFCRSSVTGDKWQTARRWSNYALPQKYMTETRQAGFAEAWREELDTEALQFEFFFLGLRKMAGVSLREFESSFGADALARYQKQITPLISQDLLAQNDMIISLTPRGVMLSDSVLEEFIPDKTTRTTAAPSLF